MGFSDRRFTAGCLRRLRGELVGARDQKPGAKWEILAPQRGGERTERPGSSGFRKLLRRPMFHKAVIGPFAVRNQLDHG